MARVTEIASTVTGRTVRHVVVPAEEYRGGLLAAGLPAPVADMLAGLFAASRRGDFGQADPAPGELLGRAPITIEDCLRDALGAAAG